MNKENSIDRIISALCHGVSVGTIIFVFIINALFLLPINDLYITVGSMMFFVVLLCFAITSMNYRQIFSLKISNNLARLEQFSVLLIILVIYTNVLSAVHFKYAFVVIIINVLSVIIFSYFRFTIRKDVKLLDILFVLYTFSIVLFTSKFLYNYIEKVWILIIAGLICYVTALFFFLYKKNRNRHVLWHFFYLHGSIFHYFIFIIILIKKI